MNSNNQDEGNGFEEWGGYMAAKKAKLAEQYDRVTCNLTEKLSNIFNGVAIFVNGYTNPTAEELKILMAMHGGIYHHYQMPGTTHIIASILPNAKVKQLGAVPIVQASWISNSISSHKLLDYRKYLLYTNKNRRQPAIDLLIPTKVVTSPTKTGKTLTAADPGFLSEFYNNSRLHLISTLGAEYKQLVNVLREKSSGVFPGREKLKSLSDVTFVSIHEHVVMHIDMDCFFVSVGLRSRDHLRGQCVVVTHAQNTNKSVNRPKESVDSENELMQKYFSNERLDKLDPHASMSEIACCSYEARRHGVRNGMFLGAALKLCPDLKAIPYDFKGYREVSTLLYKTLADYTLDIEAVSCDEMYVDVTPILRSTGISVDLWADHIRQVIMDTTGCPCSTGFGANRLQARLATKKAKPAGKFYLDPEQVDDYMSAVSLADLPGVGHATLAKLTKLGLNKCGDLHSVTLAQLQNELGTKIGENVMNFARGIDDKPLNFQHERKSISADVNYGIRFKDKPETLTFLQSLSEEVFNRLQDVGMRARCLNLKLLVRAPDAPQEPAKFLGCGVCNTINRSTTSGGLIVDGATIYKEAKNLFEKIKVPPHELRGVGIQLSRLEKAPPANSVLKRFLQNDKVESKTEAIVNKGETKATCGIKSTKKVGKSSPSLNRYFIQKPVPTSTKTNVDLNVLRELPEDIREQVIKEYKLDLGVLERKEVIREKVQQSTNPFEQMNWHSLKPILINWLDSTSSPKEIDVKMLAEHFKTLAIDRKIEDLKIALNFLYRYIARMGSCSWHDAYWTIVDVVQEGMVARYGSTLLVDRNFCCATHF